MSAIFRELEVNNQANCIALATVPLGNLYINLGRTQKGPCLLYFKIYEKQIKTKWKL